jgi:hypothetical protein
MVQGDLSTGSHQPGLTPPPVPGPGFSHLPRKRYPSLLLAALMAVVVVAMGTVSFLSNKLPDETGETFQFGAAGFKFAFGSGGPAADLMVVKEFADGYALLSSGPVSIQADKHQVLRYTWMPPRMPQEAAFFWRQADDPQNVSRIDITVPGTQFIDLSSEARWRGEITEFGFLVAGENGQPVKIGEALLVPDSLNIRLRLTWKAWTTFEEWSQQSVNFLYGGDYRQVVALPLLVLAWLGLTLMFTWLLQRFGMSIDSRQLLMITGMLFLIAWVLLDLRWSANNIRQIRFSLDSHWQMDEQQRLSSDLDGEIYQYVQRLKSSVLGDQNVRILIIGDERAIDYYMLRAKYHLLPHSANVAGHLVDELTPESLDFIIFFGQPDSIAKVPGWNKAWQQSLVKIDSGNGGAVYRINKP